MDDPLPVKDSRNSKDLYLEFLIDQTCKSYFEAGSNLGKAFLTYLLLLCLALLLVFGKGLGNDVKIPFLELTVSRIYASIVVLILSCGALYWYLSTSVLSRMLSVKLRWLLLERYRVPKSDNWDIAYPSTYTSILTIISARSGFVPGALTVVFLVFLFVSSTVLPLTIAWSIGNSFQFLTRSKFLLCFAILLLLIPSIYTLHVLFFQRTDALIKEIEETGRQDDLEQIIPVFDLKWRDKH